VVYDVGALGCELAADDCALTGYDVFGTVVVDVGLEV
jgi:hypothetical protein